MKCKINKKGMATISGVYYPNLYNILTLAENRANAQLSLCVIDSGGHKEYNRMIADILEVRRVFDESVDISSCE